MADERKPPDPYTTKQLPKVVVPESQLDAVLREVRAGREDTRQLADKFDSLAETVDTLLQDKREMRLEMGRIHKRIDDLGERAEKHSGGLTRASQVDSEHDKNFALVFTRLDGVEANQVTAAEERTKTAAAVTEIHGAVVSAKSALSKFVDTPGAKLVWRVIVLAAAGYAAAKGIKVVP